MRAALFTTVAAFLAGAALAQSSLDAYPECARSCIKKAVGNTSCGLDDQYCQCTTGAETIINTGVDCLCKSSCGTEELLSVLQITNSDCSDALKAKGETYQPPSVGLDACAGGGSSSSSTGTAASTSSTSTGSATSEEDSDSDSSSTDTSSSASSSETPESGAQRLVYQGAAVMAAAGVAVFAL